MVFQAIAEDKLISMFSNLLLEFSNDFKTQARIAVNFAKRLLKPISRKTLSVFMLCLTIYFFDSVINNIRGLLPIAESSIFLLRCVDSLMYKAFRLWTTILIGIYINKFRGFGYLAKKRCRMVCVTAF